MRRVIVLVIAAIIVAVALASAAVAAAGAAKIDAGKTVTWVNATKLKYIDIGNNTYILLKENGTPWIINGHVAKIKIVGWLNATYVRLQYVGNGTYILLTEDGKPLVINGHVAKIRIVNSDSAISETSKIGPSIIISSIPISGSLLPQTGMSYGPFTSALAIDVSITWTPSSQTLGIGILDASSGQGYARWFTGGSATISFNTDPNEGYYIVILSYSVNTQVINYNGIITTYIWQY
jgi:hypothetical protein